MAVTGVPGTTRVCAFGFPFATRSPGGGVDTPGSGFGDAALLGVFRSPGCAGVGRRSSLPSAGGGGNRVRIHTTLQACWDYDLDRQ